MGFSELSPEPPRRCFIFNPKNPQLLAGTARPVPVPAGQDLGFKPNF